MFNNNPSITAAARDKYFDRKCYQTVFERLPRVGEIFDAVAAHKGDRIAMMHLHAAFVMVNMANYLRAMGTVTDTEKVGFELNQSMVRYMFLTVDLDFGHMTALVQAIQNDSNDIITEMTKDSP